MSPEAPRQPGIRWIDHPGPPASQRCQILPCRVTPRRFDLRGGMTLHDAVVAALAERGEQTAYVRLQDVAMKELRYVIPAHDASGRHAAWYSDTHRLPAPARIHRAGLHVGRRDGLPFLHCHGLWEGADSQLAMGHLLPTESVLACDTTAECLAIEGAFLEVVPDEETRFSLFAPRREGSPAPNALLFTLRPNQDLSEAVETLAARYGIAKARLSGLGSLVGTTFADGSRLASHATEVLILEGKVEDGRVAMELVSVGIDGEHRRGQLAHGLNAVCVTCELLLHPWA